MYFINKIFLLSAQADDPVVIADNTQIYVVVTAVQRIFNFFIILVTGVVVYFFIFAGVKMSLAHGDPKALESAKWTFIYAFIGMMIVVFFFTIVSLIFSIFGITGLVNPNTPFNDLIKAFDNFSGIISDYRPY